MQKVAKKDWTEVVWAYFGDYGAGPSIEASDLYRFIHRNKVVIQAGIRSQEDLEKRLSDVTGLAVENGTVNLVLPPKRLWHATDALNIDNILEHGLLIYHPIADKDAIYLDRDASNEDNIDHRCVFMGMNPSFAVRWRGISKNPQAVIEIDYSEYKIVPVDNHGNPFKGRKEIRQHWRSGTLQLGSYEPIKPRHITKVYLDKQGEWDVNLKDSRIVIVEPGSTKYWNKMIATHYAKSK